LSGQKARPSHRAARAGALALCLFVLTAARPAVPAGIPSGVWLMPQKVAVQIFACAGLLCGRIVWLQHPRDAAGRLVHDTKNPNPALRQRPLCGQTIIWDLKPAGPDRWQNGWLYNPDDGKTYRLSAQLSAADAMIARIYLGIPLFGETWTMRRVPLLDTAGWC
jgi:uncharacterized protein (DUF2147 family)